MVSFREQGGVAVLGAVLACSGCGEMLDASGLGDGTSGLGESDGGGGPARTESGGGSETMSVGAEASDGDSGATGDGAGEEAGPGIDLQCGDQGGAGPDDGVICFYDVEGQDQGPAANIEYELVDLDGRQAIYIRLVFALWFSDNTYGATAVNWSEGHELDELVGGDRANIVMSNAAGEVVLDFDLDYLERDETAPSGFRSQGVWQKNGKMTIGDPSAILAANSSLSRNLNERGYASYTDDSPPTDSDYTPNLLAPGWDYRVVYEAWVDASLFEEEGTQACVHTIHASPSKVGDKTLDVVPDECPAGW